MTELLETARRRASKLWSFVALDGNQRRYVQLIKVHRALDRQHYRRVHARMHPFWLRFPERHYVVFGESQGLSPSREFVPGTYLRLNPDLDQAGVRPLAHYLEHGRDAGRPALEPHFDHYPPLTRRPPKHDVALVVHVHYPELWPEIAMVIERLDQPVDLFLTVTGPDEIAQPVVDAIELGFPEARVTVVPNRGRDVLPFIEHVNAGLLDGYRFVGKVHGKKSLHRTDGADWRGGLLDALLPSDGTASLLRSFEASDAAVITAEGHVRSDQDLWGLNRDRILELLGRADLPATDRLAAFPAGSMFWAKPEIIARLKSLGVRAGEFEPELGQVDGTTAHAIERIVGFLADDLAAGGVATVAELGH